MTGINDDPMAAERYIAMHGQKDTGPKLTIELMTAAVEFEQTVLGSALLAPELANRIIRALDVEDFSAQEHRVIFEAIALRLAEGGLPSPVTLAPQFGTMSFGGLSAAQYMGRLVTVGQPLKIAMDFARELREMAARRRFTEISRNLDTAAKTPGASILQAAADTVTAMGDIQVRLRDARDSLALAPAAARDYAEQLAKREKPDVIKTGLTDLDKLLGGWHRGELAVMAGRPSMGKSAFAFSSLRRAAQLGTRSVIFSLEMRREAVMQRLLSDAIWNSTSAVPYQRMAQQDVTDYEIERIQNAATSMQRQAALYIDDQPALSVADIGARAARIRETLERQGQTLDVVCIDHLGKIAATNRYAGQKVHETGEKTQGLATIARELNVAVLALHQLNRAVESRDEKRPGMADLRDSGDVEQDADVVGFLYRPAYYLERTKFDDEDEEANRRALLAARAHDLEVIIAKNRNGACRTVEVFADMASNVIRDRAANR